MSLEEVAAIRGGPDSPVWEGKEEDSAVLRAGRRAAGILADCGRNMGRIEAAFRQAPDHGPGLHHRQLCDVGLVHQRVRYGPTSAPIMPAIISTSSVRSATAGSSLTDGSAWTGSRTPACSWRRSPIRA